MVFATQEGSRPIAPADASIAARMVVGAVLALAESRLEGKVPLSGEEARIVPRRSPSSKHSAPERACDLPMGDCNPVQRLNGDTALPISFARRRLVGLGQVSVVGPPDTTALRYWPQSFEDEAGEPPVVQGSVAVGP
ncbi:hypothetical protein ABZX40_07020 [Streptomyces sp. NPDC004610]|uniref:hypothetical protein n=1 Tax=unclassified Streptomyces TaxID=2593676 RepID=UPI00339F136E